MKITFHLAAFSLLLSLNFLRADMAPAANMVHVTSPPYCSDISGDTKIDIQASGMTKAEVKCWKQGPGFGEDSTVTQFDLDSDGKGSFVFPANDYPHGPITVRIRGSKGDMFDNCFLQLYNKGGVSWNEGLPKDPPPGAAGMSLLFADDFSGPLSISGSDPKATYYSHKVPNGSQDFSSMPFSDYESGKNPFAQVDTYLRIRADANKNSSGLISSIKNDGKGVEASVPCYFECKFIAQSAPGTWPAFWLLTNYMPDYLSHVDQSKEPVDELDIIEAVGGEGPGRPNATGDPKLGALYQVTPHTWNQPQNQSLGEQAYKDMHDPIDMLKFGVPSTWYEAFHIYGCKITDTDTIYYLDNIEIARHPTFPTSKKFPLFFLINMATGSGWPVDLSRYNGLADMYVDYVRVYQGPKSSSPSPSDSSTHNGL